MSAHDELCGYCEVRGRRGQHGHLAYADCDRGELGDWLAEVGADLRWAEESECEDQAWVAHLRLRQAELVAQVGCGRVGTEAGGVGVGLRAGERGPAPGPHPLALV